MKIIQALVDASILIDCLFRFFIIIQFQQISFVWLKFLKHAVKKKLPRFSQMPRLMPTRKKSSPWAL